MSWPEAFTVVGAGLIMVLLIAVFVVSKYVHNYKMNKLCLEYNERNPDSQVEWNV